MWLAGALCSGCIGLYEAATVTCVALGGVCWWQAQTPSEAPASLQWSRQTTPFVDDFRNGLDPANWVVATGSKGCCDPNITINVDIGADTVNGHVKNVLKLTAWNEDTLCPGPKCHKYVSSAGMVQTAAHFASARYEVQAKVPAAEGVVWAVWMYHHEVHQPAQCDLYTCYCGDGGKDGCPQGKCMPPSQYEADACPMHGPGYTEPCGNTTICDAGWGTSVQGNCGMKHLKVGPDPQFVGSQTFDGYEVLVNHEIDIEVRSCRRIVQRRLSLTGSDVDRQIPANCEKTSNVCNPSCDYDYRYVTARARARACVRVCACVCVCVCWYSPLNWTARQISTTTSTPTTVERELHVRFVCCGGHEVPIVGSHASMCTRQIRTCASRQRKMASQCSSSAMASITPTDLIGTLVHIFACLHAAGGCASLTLLLCVQAHLEM